ncbi:Histidine kinase [Pedobacter terrae]|uniref:Histidine kinase n=1 Tax=Pedobacter terrae TaxID=405671 RepID=A0A1G7YR54_9SPHI|nr:histidine kinase [Pedobacter terrae]SDG99033.1 Histidine kinase [Pedobacter terrae]
MGILYFFPSNSFPDVVFLENEIPVCKRTEELEKHHSEQLLQSGLKMQKQTFETISEEIHDDVGQLLSLAKLQLTVLEQNEIFYKSLITEIEGYVGSLRIYLIL